MHKILIVEDDPAIAGAIQAHLTAWDFDARIVQDFRAVLEDVAVFQPQLVILDISLPFYNGYHWCQEIRRLSKVPILFLSSASDSLNIVMAMQMGGDDFVVKPFDLSVLTAKVQALLRRAYEFAGDSHLIVHQGAVLDVNRASLNFQGQTAELTKNELRILQTLMEHKGAVVRRDDLMARLWETDCFIDENTLTVNVTRLRKTLEGIGLTDYIETKKGIGYRVR